MSKSSYFCQFIECDTDAEYIEVSALVDAYIVRYPEVTQQKDPQNKKITLTFPTETIE